jgi:hypothetical protein
MFVRFHPERNGWKENWLAAIHTCQHSLSSLGGVDMTESVSCARCGHEISSDARYCAHCGRAVIPLQDRISKNLSYTLEGISNWQIQLLGLAALVIIGVITDHYLIDRGLYFPASYAILFFVLGGGFALIGWQWNRASNSRRFLLLLVVGAVICLLIPFIKMIDNVFLSAIAESDRLVTVNIPGVHLEASGGYKRFHSVNNPPPYWLLTIMFVGIIGYLGTWLENRFGKRLPTI